MSVPIGFSNTWPSTLPLPFIDYQGVAEVATLVSPQKSARIQRRSRQSTVYATINVTWNFTKSQYSAFLSYWEETLGGGSAKFALELRYPKISDLDTWMVQFLGNLQVDSIENTVWKVSATLQVLHITTVADAAAIIPNFLYVLDPSSSGAPFLQFLVQDPLSSGADPVAFIVQD